jgi:hypothetical protein
MEHPGSGYQHGWWCVCFLDLLGQQEAFLRSDFVPGPADQEGLQKLIDALRASLGVVDSFRRLAASFGLTVGMPQTLADSPLLELPETLRGEANRLKSTRVRELRWSDGIVYYTPLAPSADHSPIFAVQRMLLCAAALELFQLSKGRPIRGGIDVGTGIEAEGQLFGAALVKAYRLESKVAAYPRVVVGDDFVKFLEVSKTKPTQDLYGKVSAATADELLQLLARDADDRWIVDYLGPKAREQYVEALPRVTEFVTNARAFVMESRENFKSENNEKLFARYSALARYFDRNAHLWPAA